MLVGLGTGCMFGCILGVWLARKNIANPIMKSVACVSYYGSDVRSEHEFNSDLLFGRFRLVNDNFRSRTRLGGQKDSVCTSAINVKFKRLCLEGKLAKKCFFLCRTVSLLFIVC